MAQTVPGYSHNLSPVSRFAVVVTAIGALFWGVIAAAGGADVTTGTRAGERPLSFAAPEPGEAFPGGAATSRKRADRNAFSQASATLSFERELQFKVGNGLFKKLWVSAPASTTASDGLGPLYNARSCQRCHLKDGRGHPPAGPDDNAISLLVRLSIPPQGAADRALLESGAASVIPEPTYGGQLQDFSIAGVEPEGRVRIDYADVPVTLSGGETVTLRRPTLTITDLGYGPMHPETMTSMRVAPAMIGVGLLEAVPAATILAWADPGDRDGDGISGRANRVPDPDTGGTALGRFGWKAGEPTVRSQVAHAFAGDIGIGTTLAPGAQGDCTAREAACRGAPGGDDPATPGVEATDTVLDLVVFYSRNLAVPMRRGVDDPDVLAGKRLFHDAGCAACHRPVMETGVLADRPELSAQTIRPYTDLLLHDMGDGLADGRPEAGADGREWRTAPLWGIGLTDVVSGHTRFLHDGRAGSLLEAILWHDGEARAARDAVAAMTPADRARLLRFVESL